MATFLSAEAIWAARAARGQAWGLPSLLGELPPGAASNWLWEPSLAVNRGGVALVTWATQEPSVAGRQLSSRRLDPPTGWTAAERIDSGEAQQLALPYAASLALDDAANGRGRIWATRYVSGAWGAREGLQASSNQPNDPAASIDACGNAVAIWSEFESGRTRIWANRYETACR